MSPADSQAVVVAMNVKGSRSLHIPNSHSLVSFPIAIVAARTAAAIRQVVDGVRLFHAEIAGRSR